MGLTRDGFNINRVFLIILLLIGANDYCYGAWQGPAEVVTGVWGSGDKEFGIESGDTSDQLPWLTVIFPDGRLIISDGVNEREIVYNSDGTLFKVVSWYILKSGVKTVNPEYPSYKYWDIQGYMADGSIWIRTDKYFLKSPTGQLIKTSTERPLELGRVSEQPLGDGRYKVTVTYPAKVYSFIGGPFESYVRDNKGWLNAITGKFVKKISECGKEVGRLGLPKDESKIVYPGGGGFDEVRELIVEYGTPVIAPNGDVYTWKRTPDKYSILKWTWVDDPNVPTGPDAPSGLSVAVSINGLHLTWNASPQDPGCVTGYEIARATSAGGVYSTIATVDKGMLKYNDTTASIGQEYYYKVRAKAGDEYSAYTAEVSGKR